MNKIYACIDLKSFYASVECVLRRLDPLNTNLVVANPDRTEKTVCLAITPTLKQYGLKGRARLYEVNAKINEINYLRKKNNYYRDFRGKSYLDSELKEDKSLELDFIIAKPQMRKYMEVSNNIYNIYLKYFSKEDIYVYSIDEVFCDITPYINTYKLKPVDLISQIIRDIYNETGITATAGVGTNLYLAKVSMDIVAKHTKPNDIGVRIAALNEMTYRKLLWNHRPLTSFWRIGEGIQKKLEQYNIYTMGDIAKCSLENENLLYKLFGVNAELLIDHAWGYEPVTMKDIKKYKPNRNSITQGQVLHEPYDYYKTKIILKEMIDLLSLDLVSKNKVTNQLVLTIGYDVDNLKEDLYYDGEITYDHYGRKTPKPAHGTINIEFYTSSTKILTIKCLELYDKIINRSLLIRRVNISANVYNREDIKDNNISIPLDLFSENKKIKELINCKKDEENERKLQKTILDIKSKYGKNSLVKGIDLVPGATTLDRNKQVGGHSE